MRRSDLRAPFPWFGGKRKVAVGAGDWEGADAEAARAFGGEDEKKGSGSQPW